MSSLGWICAALKWRCNRLGLAYADLGMNAVLDALQAASSGRGSGDELGAHANGVHTRDASEEAGSREAPPRTERQPSVAWGEVEVEGARSQGAQSPQRDNDLDEAAAHARFEQMRKAHYRLPRHPPVGAQNGVEYDVEQEETDVAQHQQHREAAERKERDDADQAESDTDEQQH